MKRGVKLREAKATTLRGVLLKLAYLLRSLIRLSSRSCND